MSTDPEMVLVAVFKEWQTCQNLLQSQGFTISSPHIGQAEIVWKLGPKYSMYPTVSAKDKLREFSSQLDLSFSTYGPVLKEATSWIESRTLATIDLGGDHIVFVGRVVRAVANSSMFTDTAELRGEAKPLMQWSGGLFASSASPFKLDYFESRHTPGV